MCERMRMYASHSATGDPTESQTINISPPALLLPYFFAEVFRLAQIGCRT